MATWILQEYHFQLKQWFPKLPLKIQHLDVFNFYILGCTLPYYMKKASESNPIEKMKYALTSVISSAYYMNLFLKPVNRFWDIVKSSYRRNSRRIICWWDQNLLWTNFPSSSNQLLFSCWPKLNIQILWILCIWSQCWA